MVWEEMSYNKYQQMPMKQRLKEEYEPDYNYIYVHIEVVEEIIQDEFIETNISLFY